jgi:hypothetical protein
MVARVKSDGHVTWTKKPWTLEGEATAIELAPDGAVWVVATQGTALSLVKIDQDGNEKMAYTRDEDAPVTHAALATSAAGEVAVAYTVYRHRPARARRPVPGRPPGPPEHDYEAWLVQYGPSHLDQARTATLRGGCQPKVSAVAYYDDGSVLVIGSRQAMVTDEDGETCDYQTYSAMTRHRPSGALAWSTVFEADLDLADGYIDGRDIHLAGEREPGDDLPAGTTIKGGLGALVLTLPGDAPR